MISRLTAFAAVFAVIAAVGIAFAADAQQQREVPVSRLVVSSPAPVVTLPAVVVIGRRASLR